MSKYDPLWEYIIIHAPLELSFDEVYSAGDPQSADYESGIWVPVKEA